MPQCCTWSYFYFAFWTISPIKKAQNATTLVVELLALFYFHPSEKAITIRCKWRALKYSLDERKPWDPKKLIVLGRLFFTIIMISNEIVSALGLILYRLTFTICWWICQHSSGQEREEVKVTHIDSAEHNFTFLFATYSQFWTCNIPFLGNDLVLGFVGWEILSYVWCWRMYNHLCTLNGYLQCTMYIYRLKI